MTKSSTDRGKRDYNLKELREMAAKRNISGRGRMTKAQLLAALGLAAPGQAAEPAVSSPRSAKKEEVLAKTAAAMKAAPPTSTAPAKPAAPKGVFIDWGPEIPQTYQQDTVNLLIKDPEWLFAYWELSGDNSKRVAASLAGKGRTTLRLERDDGAYVDIDTGISQNWYLKVDPGLAYRAIIGFKDDKGTFLPVAASRLVRTPRVSISSVADTKWMIVQRRLEELLRYMGGFPQPGSLFAIEARDWRMVKLAWSATPVRRVL
jgi:hypothetical protein